LEEILATPEDIWVPGKNVTKATSYKLTKETLAGVQHAVYSALAKSGQPLSRNEIANATGIRIQSVCARVAELINAGLVRVVGTKWDEETCREVEILLA
jgi:predicted DNA-binding transcriptional regulator